jgi:putative glutamine amidotransferase
MFVALTMLRVHEPARGEWRDAIDARWSSFLARCGLRPLYLPNEASVAALLLGRVRPAGVVLTGGGSCSALSGRTDERDRTESVALEWAEKEGKPVVGVCRGMQVMLARAGGRLEAIQGHVGCTHTVLCKDGARDVNSYHEYGFRTPPGGYAVEAESRDGVVEAASDPTRCHTAVMWHPERAVEPEEVDVRMFRTIFGGT